MKYHCCHRTKEKEDFYLFILFSPRSKRFKNPFSRTRICVPFLLTLTDPTRPYLLMLDIGKSSRRLDFYPFFSSKFVASIIIFRHHFVKMCHVGCVFLSNRMLFCGCLPFFLFFSPGIDGQCLHHWHHLDSVASFLSGRLDLFFHKKTAISKTIKSQRPRKRC